MSLGQYFFGHSFCMFSRKPKTNKKAEKQIKKNYAVV